MSETAQPKWTYKHVRSYAPAFWLYEGEGEQERCRVDSEAIASRMCDRLNAAEPGSAADDLDTCAACGGQAHPTPVASSSASEPQACPTCHGEGRIIQRIVSREDPDEYDGPECSDCHGTGRASTPPALSEVERLVEAAENIRAVVNEIMQDGFGDNECWRRAWMGHARAATKTYDVARSALLDAQKKADGR